MTWRAICALLALVSGASGASAESFTWLVRNEYPYAVSLAFYAQDRNWVWPAGADEVYLLDDGDTHEIVLQCNAGETICFGAWPHGSGDVYWGVGPGGEQVCDDCCYVCDGGQSDLRRLGN